MNKTKLTIFDFDGVLINSEKNMELTWKKTMEENKSYKINFKKYRQYIGLPFYKILENLKINKKDFRKISIDYRKNSLFFESKIKLFNGTREILEDTKKKSKIALFTSKDKHRTKFLLNKFRLKFDFVVTGNDVTKGKPNTEGLKKILKKFKIKKKFVCYIGDTHFDLKCAQKAKIKYIHANWGFEKINTSKSITIVNNIKQLEKLL